MKATVINKEESVIYQGNIYRYGDSFEVDDSIGKSLIERGYIKGETDNSDLFDEDEVCDVKAELEKMSYPQLKAYASKLGVSASGKKEELIARILEFLAEDENEDETDFEEVDGKDSDEDEEPGDELPNTSMPE